MSSSFLPSPRFSRFPVLVACPIPNLSCLWTSRSLRHWNSAQSATRLHKGMLFRGPGCEPLRRIGFQYGISPRAIACLRHHQPAQDGRKRHAAVGHNSMYRLGTSVVKRMAEKPSAGRGRSPAGTAKPDNDLVQIEDYPEMRHCTDEAPLSTTGRHPVTSLVSVTPRGPGPGLWPTGSHSRVQ